MDGWMDVRWVALDTASSESGGMECLGVFFLLSLSIKAKATPMVNMVMFLCGRWG